MKTILLSGPGKNALSTALMQRMLSEIQAAKDEALFLTGEGDTFSAGLDLKEVAELDAAGMTKFLGTFEELVKVLFEHPAPTVAWVNGHAIAGGCVLTLCCDLRFMTARSGPTIGLNEVALGLRFPPNLFHTVHRRVPSPALDRVILEAARYDAPTARHLGLVDEIGEEPDARAMFEKLASHPREIYAAAKLALRGRLDVPEDEQRQFRETTVPQWCSPSVKARLRAALKK
jgi:enoyl-CoA hydratase/carnithine racemase